MIYQQANYDKNFAIERIKHDDEKSQTDKEKTSSKKRDDEQKTCENVKS